MQADTKLSNIEQTWNSNVSKLRPFSSWQLTRNERRKGCLAGRVGRHGVPQSPYSLMLPQNTVSALCTDR
jgi:hypothetical protein